MQITNELAAALNSVSESSGYAQKPVVKNQLAVVLSAEGYMPQSGGAEMLLLESKLLGGQHDGVVIRDYIAIQSSSPVGREIALRRLKAAMKATGCETAANTKAMTGKKLLITTRERLDKRTNQPTVDVDKYAAAGAEDRAATANHAPAAPAQSASPTVPPFAQGR